MQIIGSTWNAKSLRQQTIFAHFFEIIHNGFFVFSLTRKLQSSKSAVFG